MRGKLATIRENLSVRRAGGREPARGEAVGSFGIAEIGARGGYCRLVRDGYAEGERLGSVINNAITNMGEATFSTSVSIHLQSDEQVINPSRSRYLHC